MKACAVHLLIAVFCFIALSENTEANKAQIIENYGKIPLSFTINNGQYDPQVKFTTRGSGATMFFTQEGTTFLLSRETEESAAKRAQKRSVVYVGDPSDLRNNNIERESFALKVKFLDANPTPAVTGENRLSGNSNFFIGNDTSKWQTDVSNFEKVRLSNLYEGIDLVYYGNNSSVKYDFVVKPGEDYSRILLTYDLGENAQSGALSINDKGEMVVSTPLGDMIERKPYAYQCIDGKEVEVNVWYEIIDSVSNRFGFGIGEFDPNFELVIDPELVYSTYIGGSALDEGMDIYADNNGFVYITGKVSSSAYPVTTGSFDESFNGHTYDAFVTKINTTGSGLVYSTFIGGSASDVASGIAVDSSGNAYITGTSPSSDFPTTYGAYDESYNGGSSSNEGRGDIFVAMLNASGNSLVYSTFIGGTGDDIGKQIVLDGSNNIHITGQTSSSDYPTTTGAYDEVYNGTNDVVYAKLNSTFSNLLYSTFIGGSSNEIGNNIALDSTGNIHICGNTSSSDFPTSSGAYDETYNSSWDGFITKFNPSGNIIFSTYLGGSGNDGIYNQDVDDSGNIYLAGYCSTGFPTTTGAYDETHNGAEQEGFISKINASGNLLLYSTFITGSGRGYIKDLKLSPDGSGILNFVGLVYSGGFPVTAGAFDESFNGEPDGVLGRFSISDNTLLYSTYFGGSGNDALDCIDIDESNNVYVSGQTYSSDFPTTTGAYDESHNGLADTFVAKFSFAPTLTLTAPNGSESWTAGTTQNITWTSSNVTNVKIEYSTDSGVNWSDIATGIDASAGSYAWVIPDVPSATTLVRISDESDASVTDTSNAVFSIASGVTLTTNVLPAGSGTVTRNPDKQIYALHETVQIAANANPGYSFTMGTGWSGDITGTTNPVTITMDSDKTITANFVPIAPPKTLTLTAPNGGESWTAGTTQNITWTSSGVTSIKLEYSTDSGANWSDIATGIVASAGSYAWIVPDVQSANSLVRISDESDASVTDTSDVVFAIVQGVTLTTNVLPAGAGTVTRNPDKQIYALHETVQIAANANPGYDFTINGYWSGDISGTTNPVTITMDSDKTTTANFVVIAPPKTLALTSPNGSESWEASTTQNITWTSENVTNVKLEYSTDNGTTWTEIVSSTDTSVGSYEWIIPIRPSVNSLVRVSDASDENLDDTSDAAFTIIESTGQTIVFQTKRDGVEQIYVMNPDGSNPTRITHTTSRDQGPAWSPDGSKIAFFSYRDNGADIYTMNADGSDQTKLTNHTYGVTNATLPSWSPDGSKLVYESWTNGDYDIYVMNADGSNQIDLTNNSIPDNAAQWSPDGTKISFYSVSDGNADIYVMNADGTNLTKLTNNSSFEGMSNWSPDGSKIAFTSNRDGNYEVYIMDTDGSNQSRLTNNSAIDYVRSWSPDGSKIAFLSDRDGNNEIYIMDSDGSNQTRLTNNSSSDDYPRWARPVYVTPKVVTLTSPNGFESWEASTTQNITWTSENVTNVKLEYSTNNGTDWTEIVASTAASAGSYAWLVPIRPSVNCLVRVSDASDAGVSDASDAAFTITESTGETILFQSNRDDNYEIYVMNPNGSNQTRLTYSAGNDMQPSWSPDGSQIAFSSRRDGDDEVYIMDADGSNLIKLTDNSSHDMYPKWSPDGSKFLFRSYRDGNEEIYVMNEDGSNQTNLTNNSSSDILASWSPDGSKIVFDTNRDGKWNVYVMNADGSNPERLTNASAEDYYSTWSPDGSKIAFHSDRDGNMEIYIMDPNGDNQTRITSNSSRDMEPSWSPDGSKIAFMSDRDTDYYYEVYTMNSDGTNQTRLTNYSATDNVPQWARPVITYVSVTSPNGSESWEASTTKNINWTSSGVTNVKLEYSTNNGTDWTEIVASTPAAAGSYAWLVPIRPSANCLVRVSDASVSTTTDMSDVVFTIAKGAQAPIAFTSTRNGNAETYVINPDGTNLTRLTYNSYDTYAPEWSPDGNKITFFGNNEIYVMDADGSNQIKLTNNSNIENYSTWSSDGYQIAFSSTRDGNYEIYIMNADGTNYTNITNNSATDYYPTWSPDGSQIAFSSTRDGNYEIYIMNADGSNQIRLTNNLNNDDAPTWSPDGSQIAFTSNRESASDIYVMNPDGSNPTRLTTTSVASVPSYSSDGTKIAFQAYVNGLYHVYFMNADGSNQTLLTDNSTYDIQPCWQKTTSVFVTSPQGGENWTVGTTKNITWVHNGVSDVKIEYSTDGGSIWNEIVPSTAASNTTTTAGSYEWIVEDTASINCLVRISDTADATVTDISNAVFTIESAATVTLTAPNGGEEYIIGTDVDITWDVENVTNDLVIELSTDNGDTWAVIVEEIDPVSGTYLWTVPEVESSDCLIRITDSVIAEVTDSSDAPFRIKSLETVITELIDDIIADEDILGGLEKSLTKKLENILSKLEKGDIKAAINQLGAFINQVEAKRGKKNGLTDEQADELIGLAQQIVAILLFQEGGEAATEIYELKNEIIADEDIKKGLEKNLTHKLDEAIMKLLQGKFSDAKKKLDDFIKHVEKERGKKKGLTDEQADDLIAAAQVIIAMIPGEEVLAKRVASQEKTEIPETFSLSQNSPNPFNPITTIEYTIPSGNSVYVRLNIYDLRGALVRTLVDHASSPGIHTVVWDGTDETGNNVSTGVYFYQLRAGEFIQTKKMLFMK
ncbi:SBBP repeat-containing protein [Candidatus Omnitrophota bacterium]